MAAIALFVLAGSLQDSIASTGDVFHAWAVKMAEGHANRADLSERIADCLWYARRIREVSRGWMLTTGVVPEHFPAMRRAYITAALDLRAARRRLAG